MPPRLRCLLLAAACGLAAQPAVRAQQPDAKEVYARAIELDKRGNYPAALSLLWEAGSLAPRDPEIQNSLGEALERLGALDAAIDAYRRALAERPAFRKAANSLILALVKAGKGPEAVERARANVSAAPDDPNAHFTLGLAQSEQDVDAAIKSFRRTLELDPRHTLARYNLALVLKRTDRLTEAVAELTRAVELNPRPEVHYTLGVIYWHQGALDRAETAFRAAIATDSRYVDAHYSLGTLLLARRDAPAAAAVLRRAIVLRPDLVGAHYTLARALQAAGDDSAARSEFAEADRLRQRAAQEQEASVWTALGTRKLDGGDSLGAVDAFRRALTVDETYAPAHYQLGRAFRKLGEHDAARAAFARARELNPSLVPPRDLQ
jgi:tetratricopeptide (TPR) repeat protein